MDIYNYYKENKESIDSQVLEIASELAEKRLMDTYGLSLDELTEQDPAAQEESYVYKEKYLDEIMGYLDEEYSRLCQLMHFDVNSYNGVQQEKIHQHPVEKQETPNQPIKISYNYIGTLEITKEQAFSVPSTGSQKKAIYELMDVPEIRRQLDRIDPEQVKCEIDSWDILEPGQIEDHTVNLAYILQDACLKIWDEEDSKKPGETNNRCFLQYSISAYDINHLY